MTFLTTILSTLSPLANLAPYHLLTYGTLLGTSLYQTFIITKVSYNALPISAFTTLQKRIFPVYFKTQSLLLVLTALTVPPYGLVSLFRSKADWIPLVAASSFAMLNLFLCGPRTRKMMIERIHQETREGTKYNAENISDEMKAITRAFSRAHAMSIHLNLLAVIATVWYGIGLGSKLDFET